MAYAVEHTSPDVLTIRHTGMTVGWEQRYLLISDVHFDSPHCDRRLLSKHLEQAKDSGAGILCIGDWFDAMQGKNDKRGSKGDLKPEDKENAYFNALLNNSSTYLQDYADQLVMVSDGNHDTSIVKHNEIDILELMCDRLNVFHGGYSGFIRFMFEGNKSNRSSVWAYFEHGSGGGGPVTKGTIQTNRRAAKAWADIYVSGHIHESWVLENVVAKPVDSGRVLLATQTHVQLPTYKQEYTMRGGFHVEKGRPPKPLGGYWLIFYYDHAQHGKVGYRFERAN